MAGWISSFPQYSCNQPYTKTYRYFFDFELMMNSTDYIKIDSTSSRRIVLLSVKQNVYTLWHASEELKNDKEVVLEAVKDNGNALEYASKEHKNDKEFILEAMKQDIRALKYVSKKLRNDKNFVAFAVGYRQSSLQYAPKNLHSDPYILGMVDFVKKQFSTLEEVKEYVKESPLHLQFVDFEYLQKKEGVRFCFDILSKKSEHFLIHRFDISFVMFLLDLDLELFFKFVDTSSREHMLAIVINRPSLIVRLTKFKEDKDFIWKVSRSKTKVLEYIDPVLFFDMDFLSLLQKPNKIITKFFEESSASEQEKGNWKASLLYLLVSMEFRPNQTFKNPSFLRQGFDIILSYLSQIPNLNLVGSKMKDELESFTLEEISEIQKEIESSFHSEVKWILNDVLGIRSEKYRNLFRINQIKYGFETHLSKYFKFRMEGDDGKTIFVGLVRNNNIGKDRKFYQKAGFGVEFVEKTRSRFLVQTKQNNYYKVFEGTYSNNLRNGRGIEYKILKGKSEQTFEGLYLNGNRHGKGEKRDPEGGTAESGFWKNGKLDPNKSVISFPCPDIPYSMYSAVAKQMKDSSIIGRGKNGVVYKIECSKAFSKKMRKRIGGQFAAVKIMKFI